MTTLGLEHLPQADLKRLHRRLHELDRLFQAIKQEFGKEDTARRVHALLPMLPPVKRRVAQRHKAGRPPGSVTDKAAFEDIRLLLAAELIRDCFPNDLSEHAIATIIIEDIERKKKSSNQRRNKAEVNRMAKRLELARKRATKIGAQFRWPRRDWSPNDLWEKVRQRRITATLEKIRSQN
jgi:hypothetical protein